MDVPPRPKRITKNSAKLAGASLLLVLGGLALITTLFAIVGWFAFGFLQFMGGHMSEADARDAILPPELRVVSSDQACASGGCWTQLVVENTSQRSLAEIVRDLPPPSVRIGSEISSQQCSPPNWLASNRTCTYLEYHNDNLLAIVFHEPIFPWQPRN